jgi:hypothetical protein
MRNPRITRQMDAREEFPAVFELGVQVENGQVAALVKQVQLVSIGEERASTRQTQIALLVAHPTLP